MHDWFSNALLPKLSKIHPGAAIVLEALIAPHVPQLLFVAGFSSLEEFASMNSKLTGDAELNAAYEKLERGPEPPFESQTITLLEAAAYSPEIITGKREKPRLFELRVYHSPTRSQLRALHERFAGPELRIFHRTGIFPVLYSSTLVGPNMPNLTYLIPFDSLAAREQAWEAFGAHPDWIKTRKESVDKFGQISSVSEIAIYRATPYSPVK